MKHPAALEWLLPVALLACMPVGCWAAEPPSAAVSIAEMDPASPAVLHGDDDVYVHVHYTSDAPIKIWVRPFTDGAASPAMTMGSLVYPAGEGEAFGWFACPKACRVDSIHLQLATAQSGYPYREEATPVDFAWDGAPGQWHTPAAWVKPLQDAEAAREKQAYDAYMSQPLGTSGVIALTVFGIMLLGALFVCVIWPLMGLIRWEGKWRWLASAPLVVTILKTASLSADLARDPTSHNLLPFEYLIIAAIATPYMLVVWLLRRKALKTEAREPESEA